MVSFTENKESFGTIPRPLASKMKSGASKKWRHVGFFQGGSRYGSVSTSEEGTRNIEFQLHFTFSIDRIEMQRTSVPFLEALAVPDPSPWRRPTGLIFEVSEQLYWSNS